MRFLSGLLITVLFAFIWFAPSSPAGNYPRTVSQSLTCAHLANSLQGSSGIKSVESHIVPANPPNVSFCQVNVLYGANANQNINIRVGLPLSSVDGGSGGVQGAWNGRTEGVGGGGCTGNLNVTAP